MTSMISDYMVFCMKFQINTSTGPANRFLRHLVGRIPFDRENDFEKPMTYAKCYVVAYYEGCFLQGSKGVEVAMSLLQER